MKVLPGLTVSPARHVDGFLKIDPTFLWDFFIFYFSFPRFLIPSFSQSGFSPGKLDSNPDV